MFFIGRNKKANRTKQVIYKNLTVLYFHEPAYEKIRMELDQLNRKLELFFSERSYILDMNRLSASYYSDLCTTFLAQGTRCFGEHWEEMQPILQAEQRRREPSSEGMMRPKDGMALQYVTKEQEHILILILSDVFLETAHIVNDIQALVPQNTYSRIEL